MEEMASVRDELVSLLEEKRYKELRLKLSEMMEVDIASIMDSLENEDSLKIFRILPKSMAADVFAELEVDDQKYIIMSLSTNEASNIIDNLMADDAADFLEEMPANVVKRILANASPEQRKDVNHLLKYPDDSAGSIMTVEYVDLKRDMTVADAILRIREIGLDAETTNICYVLDKRRLLVGTVALRYLLIKQPDEVIGDIMNDSVISIKTTDDQEEAARVFQKYDFTAMPVVDNEKMAAIIPDQTDRPYLKIGVLETFKNRMPWLLFLMVSATFTGAIITRYETALAAYVTLTAYIPMLMDTGGNAGSQASVSVIRGLSLREIQFSDFFRVLWKEARVAAICGIVLSSANFVKLMLIDKLPMNIAGIICVTLVLVVIFAKSIGCTLPMVASKIKLDPAVMASPLITTIVDAVSLLIYFGLVTHLLSIAV